MSEQVRTTFVRHEWDAPVTFSVQEFVDKRRVVSWALCARCRRLVATCADVQRKLVLTPGEGDIDLRPVMKMLSGRLGVSPCPGKPDEPKLPGEMP